MQFIRPTTQRGNAAHCNNDRRRWGRHPGLLSTPWLLLSLAPALVTGCGSHRTNPANPVAVAQVNGRVISRAAYQSYLDYTSKFYSWAHPGSGTSAPCQGRAHSTAACTLLKKQVLRRMLEEQVIVGYAERHGIRLAAGDQASIQERLAVMRMAGAKEQLFGHGNLSPSFLRRLLTIEFLVRKVEDRVAPPNTKRGFSYELRKYILTPTSRTRTSVYRQALDLSTDGTPVPPGTVRVIEWEAPFRLSADVRSVLTDAHPGQFVGPFHRHGRYLVIQVLASGKHRYGQPARLQLETRYFQRWLQTQLKAASAACYDASGKQTPCPV